MSLLSILKSKTAQVKLAVVTPVPAARPVITGPDLAQIQSQAREIILEAKDEAIRIKDQAVKDAKVRLEEIELQAKSLTQNSRN